MDAFLLVGMSSTCSYQCSDFHDVASDLIAEIQKCRSGLLSLRASLIEGSSFSLQVLVVEVEDNSSTRARAREVAREKAEKIFVVGSIPALGKWDKTKAVELIRSKGNTFEAIVAIPSDVVGEFEYKFFEYPSGQYESGPNRKSDAHLVEPQREFDPKTGSLGLTRVVDLESIWEGLLLRFLIYHPLQDPSSVLACSGSMQALGGWLGAPRKMGLGNERTLLTGVKGRCWEMTFPAPAQDSVNVQYRYCIIDGKKGTAVFEREPNRALHRVPGAQSAFG